jgi:hypothetical protein
MVEKAASLPSEGPIVVGRSSLREAWLGDAAGWQGKVSEARKAIMGSDERTRAEQVRKVIGKIVCHFDYRQCGQQSRSNLTGVDIAAVDGGNVTFSNAGRPGRG